MAPENCPRTPDEERGRENRKKSITKNIRQKKNWNLRSNPTPERHPPYPSQPLHQSHIPSVPPPHAVPVIFISAQSHSSVMGICHRSCGTNGCWNGCPGMPIFICCACGELILGILLKPFVSWPFGERGCGELCPLGW